ncbi:MAG: DUF2459 domain-containing protein [Rhodospirillales bacterium]|nr:DUF2459 domain-containing protein [Rhodospirillales bacterium]
MPPAPSLPPGAATRTIAVADRGWHTDLCVAAPAEGSDPLVPLAEGFPGARFLCFGFGERQYLLSPGPGLLETLSALLPSRAALLMTALRAPPAAAFGADSVVVLRVTEAGETALRGFLRGSVQNDAAGAPIRLRDGPYLGSVFFAATGTYDAFTTCNTWTADGLRTAGVKIGGPVIFAGQVMSQLRQIAAKPPQ